MKHLSTKILAITLLCIVIMSNVLSAAFASSSGLTDCDNIFNKLYAFGLFKDDQILNSGSAVTRAEAAYTLSKIMGYELELKKDNKNINDISGISYENAIYSVVGAGLMSCMYENSFKPDIAVSYGDIITAVIKTLGYDNFVIDKSNVNEYITVYKRYVGKVVKGENSDVKWSEFVNIIDESIEADMVNATLDKNNLSYEISKDKTVLSERLKITKYSGVITATEFSDLYGNGSAREGYIKIDNDIFKCNEVFTADLLGLSVDAWVQEDSGSNNGVIKYIDKIDSDDRIVTIKSTDIESLSAKKIEYSKGNKTKTINLPSGIYVLYNGVAVPDYSGIDFKCDQGVVYVIDSNGDGKNDVLSVFNYEKTVVKAVDFEEIIIDLHHNSRNIELKNEDVKVYKNGIPCNKDAIKKNDVLSVLKDINGNPLIIVINESTVSGKVSGVETSTENGSAYKLVINGIKFPVDSTFDSLTNYDWKKSNGIYFLDYNGVIVGYIQSGFDYEFGYIIKAARDPDSIKDSMMVRILNSDGIVETLYTSEKIKINDSRYKTIDDISDNIAKYERNLVRYKIDTENKLSMIETSQNGDDWINANTVQDGKLRITYSSDSSKIPYIRATDMISDKAKVGKNTIFFKIPENEDDYDKNLYSAQLGAPMYDGENVKVKTYSLSSEKISNDACIIYYDNNYTKQNLSESSPIGVVEAISESLDNDGEEKTALTVRTKDGSVTVMESEYGYFKSVTGADGTTGLSVKPGDVVRYLTDYKGQIPYLIIMSRVDDEGKLHTYGADGGIVDKFCFKTGYLYKRNDTQIVLTDNTDELTADKWSVFDIKSAKIFVCENTKKSKITITTGSIEDMNGYLETQKMHPVSIHLTYGQPQFVVIYK